jgi:signal transduction histidine kinase
MDWSEPARLDRLSQFLRSARERIAGLWLLLLCAAWAMLALQAVNDRDAALNRAQNMLSAFAGSFADYATALMSREAGPHGVPHFSAADALQLGQYLRTTPLPPGNRFSLWTADGKWLAGDPPAKGQTSLANPPGRFLTATAARRRFGVVAQARRSREDALSRWQSDYWFKFAILLTVSFASLIVWYLLYRGKHAGARSDRRWRALFYDNLDCNYMIKVVPEDVTAATWPVIEMNGSGKALLSEWGASEETGKAFCDKAPAWAGQIIAQKLSISAFTNTSVTHRFASADRLVCYVLTSVPVIEPDGSVRQLILRLRDISDREQKDVAFERAIFRAEEASRAKSAILANTSHELRTPLNAIIGYSELMQLGIGGPLNAQQTEYVNIVHSSGRHLLAVISDILDLAKIEAGRFELHEEPVDLKAMAEDCLALVKVRAQGKPIMLYADIAELPALNADPLRLKQVLVNLLSNAVKFTEKGEVSLKAEETEAGGVSLIVSDTGIGMTDEEVALALQPFRQADSGRAISDEGTGLGLPIAKNLTRLHGGTFLVHSAKGVGTKVILTFGPERLVKREAPLVERCA